jgi:3-oxoacyl-(acyl-carrier-protein) synthase
MRDETPRRVVITGLGAITPHGTKKDAFWQATCAGISGISQLKSAHANPQASIQVAGLIHDFATTDYLDRKLARRTDRMTHFALAAIQEAIADAGLSMTQEEPQRVGAVIANTMGGANYVLTQLQALYTRGPHAMSVYTAIAGLHVANVGQAAIRYGIQGYCKTPVNDTVGGLDALGLAYTAIKHGRADVIIAGGCDSFLHPFILQVLASQGQYVTGDHPNAYRPFDQRATGLILAEGAGICILETYEHARRRSATIYGEIAGYGQTNDAHGLTPPSRDGTRYARAMQLAMQEAQVQANHLAYISLDGRAIRSSDCGEAHALCLAFGNQTVTIPVSVPRTTIGHSYAAAGVLDTITAALALKHQIIPPTINCDEPDPCYNLNLIRDHARDMTTSNEQQAVLLGGRAIGGVNVALVLKKFVD